MVSFSTFNLGAVSHHELIVTPDKARHRNVPICSKGAPTETVWEPLLYTHNTAAIGLTAHGEDDRPVLWCVQNNLELNRPQNCGDDSGLKEEPSNTYYFRYVYTLYAILILIKGQFNVLCLMF